MKVIPISAVVPSPSPGREDDYLDLLSNVIQAETEGKRSLHVVDEFTAADARASLPECMDAVKEDLDGLSRLESFKLVEKK